MAKPLPKIKATIRSALRRVGQSAKADPMTVTFNNNASATITSASSGTISVTSSGTNQVIYISVATANAASALGTASVTASGLTFTRRAEKLVVASTGEFISLSTWWAPAAATQTGTVVTVKLTGTCDAANIIATSVAGTNSIAYPFDPNTSLPAIATDTSGSTSTIQTTGVSTTLAHSAIVSTETNLTVNPSAGTGYTGLKTSNNAPSHSGLEQQTFTAVQSSVTVPWGGGAGNVANWVNIVDAFTSDTPIVVDTPTSSTITAAGSGTVSLTTAGANRLVLIGVSTDNSVTGRTVSSVTASGLTFAQAQGIQVNGLLKEDLEVWWAWAASTQTGVTVTVNLSGTAATGTITAGGIAGVLSSTKPFDPGNNPQATNSDVSGSSTTPTVTYSTLMPVGIDVCFMATDNFVSVPVAGSGWTLWKGQANIPDDQNDIYKIQNQANTNTNPVYSGTTKDWATIVVSLVAASIVSSSITTRLTGISQTANSVTGDGAQVTTTLTKVSQSLVGISGEYGTISISLAKVLQTLSATLQDFGTISQAFKGISQTLSAQEVFTGTITTTLGKIKQDVEAQELDMRGPIVTALNGISQSLSGDIWAKGTIATSLTGLSQILAGFLQPSATITSSLAGVSQALSALESRNLTGTITTSLRAVSQELFGTIPTPGQGQFWAWWSAQDNFSELDGGTDVGQGFPVIYNASGSPAANTSAGGSTYNVVYIDGTDTIVGGALPTVVLGVYDTVNAGMTGNHIGIYGFIQNNQTQVAANPGYNLVGVWGFAKAIANMGGSDTGANSAGRLFGMNPQVAATTGATNLASVVGMEVDVSINTGCSSKNRFGVDITTIGGDAVQGASLDVALLISCVNASSAWKKGICLNTYSGAAAIDPAGTVLEASGGYTVQYGIDLSGITCTGAELKTSSSVVKATFIGANTATAVNSTDKFAVVGNFNSPESQTLRNSNAGTAAQTVLYFANDNNTTQTSLTLNSSTFSGGDGAAAFAIKNGSAPLVIGGGTETIKIKGNSSSTINLKLPTSSAGLVSGDWWINSGVVTVVP